MIKSLFCSFLLAVLVIQSVAAADAELDAALNAAIRTDEDKARDASRKPAETLAFFGLTPDAKVLELVPGGGWYTKILANYLKQKGELYLAIGADSGRLKLTENKLDQVKIIGEELKLIPTEQRGIRDVEGSSFGAGDFDFVLTFRNMHNVSEAGRVVINKAVYDALKPGGIYGIIDHTRRHMEPATELLWRRLDPVQMIKEVQAAGFVFEDYSNLHARPADKLIYDSTHESLNRDSDRFTLKFRKPG